MTDSATFLYKLIRQRRAIFPNNYIDKPIPKTILVELLENANWAPTHKLTQPWRFKVFRGDALPVLGEAMASTYKAYTPAEQFREKKFQKIRRKSMQCGAILAICMQRHPDSLPEWEEIAAVACAVQNMWLTCTAYNIGCYWSSPKDIIQHAETFLNLKEQERCLGFFYMGYHHLPPTEGKRDPVSDKVEWIG